MNRDVCRDSGINRVDGNKLYPQEMPRIKPRTKLYRNFDQEFERILSRKSAERKIAVNILLADNNFGFSLTLTDEDDNSVTLTLPREKEPARTPQADNLKTQLAKLGNTLSKRKRSRSLSRRIGSYRLLFWRTSAARR